MCVAETWTLKADDNRRVLKIPWTVGRTYKSIVQELEQPTMLSVPCEKNFIEYFRQTARRNEENLEKTFGRNSKKWKKSSDISIFTNLRTLVLNIRLFFLIQTFTLPQ